MTAPVRVTAMLPEHAEQVLTIYQLGIDSGHATFETTAPTWADFDATKLPEHRLVAIDTGGRVLGWAAVVPVSDRCAYAGVVEHSVYVRPDAQGHGIGYALLRALLTSTEAAGIWTVQSGIFPPEHRQPRRSRQGRLSRHRHPRTDRPPPRPVA